MVITGKQTPVIKARDRLDSMPPEINRQNARAVPIVVNKALPGCREKRLPIPHPVTYLALQ